MRHTLIALSIVALTAISVTPVRAKAGKGEWDCRIITHSQDGGWKDHEVNLHYEDISVDSTSPPINSRQDYLDLKTASLVSQGAFDSEVDEVGGQFDTWYDNFPAAAQLVVREAYKNQ